MSSAEDVALMATDHYVSFISRIRQSFPSAISFINPPIFAEPPDLSEHVKQGRMALSSHFYDGLTMLGKRRHRFNADAVGLQRGHINMLQAIKFGSKAIKDGIQSQFSELKSDAHKQGGIASDQTGMREYPSELQAFRQAHTADLNQLSLANWACPSI